RRVPLGPRQYNKISASVMTKYFPQGYNQVIHNFSGLKKVLEPDSDPFDQLIYPGSPDSGPPGVPADGHTVSAVEGQAGYCRKTGSVHGIGQSGQRGPRRSDPHSNPEYVCREINDAGQSRGASGEDHSGAQPACVARICDIALDEIENFIDALMDDVRQRAVVDGAFALCGGSRQRDHQMRI